MNDVDNIISDIKIQNIKGFAVPAKTIVVNLSPSKINLCVAPNGFGKSSLAVAFGNLKPKHLDINDIFKHVDHTADDSFIEICIGGNIYRADKNSNEIGKILNTYVIKCRTYASCKKTPTQYITHVKPYVDISNVMVCKAKSKPSEKIGIKDIRKSFGKNGIILNKIDNLLTYIAKTKCKKAIKDILEKYKTKRREKLVNDVKEKINSVDGGGSKIASHISNDAFSKIENEEYYSNYLSITKSFFDESNKLERFCCFYQLLYMYKENKEYFFDIIDYVEYVVFRKKLDENLKYLNTSSKKIKTSVDKGDLVVKFPKADLLSNGQRDVMTFVVELLLFQKNINPQRKQLLIIDEVFDYLDDVNVIAAQYFLSKILADFKGNVYIMLLTHLSPYYFRNYAFSEKVINTVYLENSHAESNDAMMTFISFRESLDRKVQKDNELYNSISCNLFHYNPNPVDLEDEIKNRGKSKQGLKTTWGKCDKLKEYLIKEINKYFSDKSEYDPYAVAMALRLRAEKLAYEKLPTEDLKVSFIKEHTTKKKFDLCESHGITIPSVYYIVNAIHNEADHLKYDQMHKVFQEKNTVYKLQNLVVKNILKGVFEYNNSDILPDALS